MVGFPMSSKRVRLLIIVPDDYLMQPTRSVCPPKIKVDVISNGTVDSVKKVIATQVHELTRTYRLHQKVSDVGNSSSAKGKAERQ